MANASCVHRAHECAHRPRVCPNCGQQIHVEVVLGLFVTSGLVCVNRLHAGKMTTKETQESTADDELDALLDGMASSCCCCLGPLPETLLSADALNDFEADQTPESSGAASSRYARLDRIHPYDRTRLDMYITCCLDAVLPSPYSQLKQAEGKVLPLTLCQNQKAKGRILRPHQHQQQVSLEALVPYLQTLVTKMTSLLASLK